MNSNSKRTIFLPIFGFQQITDWKSVASMGIENKKTEMFIFKDHYILEGSFKNVNNSHKRKVLMCF